MLNFLFPVFVWKHPNGSKGPFVLQFDQREEPADSRVPPKRPSGPRPFEGKKQTSPSCGQQVAVEDARTPQPRSAWSSALACFQLRRSPLASSRPALNQTQLPRGWKCRSHVYKLGSQSIVHNFLLACLQRDGGYVVHMENYDCFLSAPFPGLKRQAVWKICVAFPVGSDQRLGLRLRQKVGIPKWLKKRHSCSGLLLEPRPPAPFWWPPSCFTLAGLLWTL